MMTLKGAAILMAAAMTAPAVNQSMPMDTPVSMGPVQAVCTGVGSGKDNPEWQSFPLRIEFANAGAQNLASAHVTLAQGGQTVADFSCDGPWVLLKGQPGSYRVTATIEGMAGPASATVALRPGPQRRVVLRFPMAPNQ